MNSGTKRIRQWVPRRWRRWLRRLLRPPLYAGNYASWAAAQQASRGYDDAVILEKVVTATRAVRAGRAAWERDTVLFNEPSPNAPVLRALRQIAAANDGRLSVVDFGGALGSFWWQHRSWLGDLAEIHWSVVEQPGLVEVGQREFTVGPLRFYPSLAACLAVEQPTVVLLSSVLAYLEDPHGLLQEIRAQPFRHLIIDRTGFVTRGRGRLTVQHVPAAIYEASYPAWFFERAHLLAPFAAEWRVVEEWVTDDDADIDADHRGMWLERKTPGLET